MRPWHLVGFASCVCAFALNPGLDVSQYAHKSWTIREGFFKGQITSLAQTPDGYLWLGTEFGLLRFDGIRATAWNDAPGHHLASENIRTLSTARDGTLWIGTTKELVSWKNGKLVSYPEFAGRDTYRVLEDREGSIWVGGFETSAARVCAIQKGGVQCYGGNGEFGNGPDDIYEDHSGSLWISVRSGLWRWRPGPPKFYPMPGQRNGVPTIEEDARGGLLLGTDDGLRRYLDGKIESYLLPGTPPGYSVRSLVRDRDGVLWIGTLTHGLLHVGQGRAEAFTPADGLSGVDAHKLLEDREGNIWVATDRGLDRFRDFAVSTFSERQGLTGTLHSVLAVRDGSVWTTTADGLKRWSHGLVTSYRGHRSPPRQDPPRATEEVIDSALPEHLTSLFEDDRGRIWIASAGGLGRWEQEHYTPVRGFPDGNVMSMIEDRTGNLWIANQHRGLIGLSPEGQVQQISWSSFGHTDPAIATAADPRGGIWLGFFAGGLKYFTDGQVRSSYSTADGLGKGPVKSLRLARDGTLWAATEGGLSRLKDGHVSTLTSKHGLPCDTVHWSIEDDDHSVWLYTACGLVRIAAAELDTWAVSGKSVHATLLGSSDGVKMVAVSGYYTPQVSKAPDGKLWFGAASDGVSVIDPHRLSSNRLAPAVHIEQVIADRTTYDLARLVRLPALTRELEIDYAALSLVDPEKNQFRYKLEGYDRDWQEAGARRQAFYTNLGPRNYRFRVTGSNNSGVWNESGTFFDFSVEPAYYQTNWFLGLCVMSAMAVLATVYRLRQRRLERQFHMRLEERVGERTRIARELHDTLLQSFQGVLMKLSVLSDQLPDPSALRDQFEHTIDQGRQAITEGRDAVQGLRSSTTVTNALADAIREFGKEFAAELAANPAGPACPEIRLQVDGATRELAAIVRDEVHRIACECVRNACRHADAAKVEVMILYGGRHFRLRVVDDGKGIDPKILAEGGRAGHHGLPGIQERAQLVGGKLTIMSRVDAGTEIELTIPASFAYLSSRPGGST